MEKKEEKKEEKKDEKKNQLSILQKDITDSVTSRISELQEMGALAIPETYAVGNELKLAFFVLQDMKNKDGDPVLKACPQDNIANALLEMVIQGMSVWKKQGYFIVYGKKLEFEREYHGNIALALRTGKVADVPNAEIIYEGDDFKYRIVNGKKEVVEHSQDLGNIDIEKIKGAYAVVPLADGTFHTEIMTITQIRQAWMQGAMKGKSPAHNNFTDQMCKKTVINRALKLYISSSDDEELLSRKSEPVAVENKKEILEAVEFTDSVVLESKTLEDKNEPEPVEQDQPEAPSWMS